MNFAEVSASDLRLDVKVIDSYTQLLCFANDGSIWREEGHFINIQKIQKVNKTYIYL